MRFNLAVVEPKGFPYGHFLDDAIRLMAYALESLGHDVILQINKLCTDRLNVVWGCHYFQKPDDAAMIASAGPYIAVQSEVVHDHGLGFANKPGMMDSVYLPFLRGATAVWDAKPACIEKLRRLGLRTFRFPLGYHPRMEEIVHKQQKDIDFSFFGSITPHRKMLFDALLQRGFTLEAMFDARRMFRDDLVARTKVHVAPWQSPDFNQLSLQRVCYLLNNRCLCVVEACPDQGEFEHCFLSAETEAFVECAVDAVQRPDRDVLTQSFFERYREIRMEDGVARLLEESLGGATHYAPASSPPTFPGQPAIPSVAGTAGSSNRVVNRGLA